jgi:carboxymethylenebutenolidase
VICVRAGLQAGVSNPPVVLVAMEIFGLHEYIKDVTRRLAKLGAFAVAPDYYAKAPT